MWQGRKQGLDFATPTASFYIKFCFGLRYSYPIGVSTPLGEQYGASANRIVSRRREFKTLAANLAHMRDMMAARPSLKPLVSNKSHLSFFVSLPVGHMFSTS